MRAYKIFALAVTIVGLAGCAGGASDTVTMTATLNGQSEVPPKSVAGAGTGTFTFNPQTKQLTYNVSYSGLTGPATAAHIHMPAAAGANAPPVIPFQNPASPITGTATLTDQQAQWLMSGQTYVNVHTAANPPGEIRGQVVK